MEDLIKFIHQTEQEKKRTLDNLKIQFIIGFIFTTLVGLSYLDGTKNIIIAGFTFIIFFGSILLNTITIVKMFFFKNKYDLFLEFYSLAFYLNKKNDLTINEKINILSEKGLDFNKKADFYKLRPIYLQDILALLNVKPYNNQKGNYDKKESYNIRKDKVTEALEFIFKTEQITAEMRTMKLITKEYKALAKILHPDKPTGSNEAFQVLNNHYQLLKNTYN